MSVQIVLCRTLLTAISNNATTGADLELEVVERGVRAVRLSRTDVSPVSKDLGELVCEVHSDAAHRNGP